VLGNLTVAGKASQGATDGPLPRSARRASTISAAEIELKPVEWLWPGRVPANAITVLAGDPGLGKSLLTIYLAARLTRGALGGQASNVLMLTAEDSLAHTVRPRLEAADADIVRVHFASMARDGLETPILLPHDVAELGHLVTEKHAKLVVIDPLMAHLAGTIDSWKDQKIREALQPLHAMAEQTRTAVLVVAHLNKGQSSDPLQRLGGSIGIPAAARSVLLLGRDPDDRDGDRRVLAQVKNNVGPPAPSLAFAIEPVTIAVPAVKTAKITKVGTSTHTASDLLVVDQPERGSKLAAAIAFLETELKSGPRSVKALREAAQQLGFSQKTLDRAGDELDIESTKSGFDRGWEWSLPSSEQQGVAKSEARA
jgi:hypothetical protein